MIVMKLDPIPGDCKIPDLKDYLTVNSVSWELTREFSDSGKMGTADINMGMTDMPPITVGKSMDIGSCDLMQNAISGKSMGTAEIKFLMQQGTDQKKPMSFLEFKLNNARRFLMEGDKVKITVMFRGREMVHTYRGRKQLDAVVEHLKPIAKLENPPRMEGRFMSMILVADREAVADAKRAEEEAVKQAVAEAEAANTESGPEEAQPTAETAE